MSSVNIDHGPFDRDPDPPSSLYYYDLRVEVQGTSQGGQIPLIQTFLRLAEEIEKLGVTMIMCDAHKKSFEAKDLKTMKDFAQRFNTTSIASPTPKAMLGFSIDSTVTLTSIKNSLIDFLRTNRTFIRIHKGGFSNLKQSFLGFFLNVSPRVASPEDLYSLLTGTIFTAWTKRTGQMTQDALRQKFPNLIDEDGDLKTLPFIIQKGQVFSKFKPSNSIKSEAMVVYAPSDLAPELSRLLTLADCASSTIEEFVPISLLKDDPATYYQLVCIQAKFANLHRRVQIMYVPPTAVFTIKNHNNQHLPDVLQGCEHITRVTYDHLTQRILVSTNEAALKQVRSFIDKIITEFPYNAKRVGPDDHASTASHESQKSRFQKLISTHTVSSEDMSTIKTTARFTAWNRQPPPEILVDFDTQYPPLTTTTAASTTTHETKTFTTTSQLSQMVQDAIAEQDAKWDKRMNDLLVIQQQQQASIQALTSTLMTTAPKKSSPENITPNLDSTSVLDSSPATNQPSFITRTELEPMWKVLEHITKVLDRLDEKYSSPPRKQVRTEYDEPAHLRTISRQLATQFQIVRANIPSSPQQDAPMTSCEDENK